MRIKDHFQLAIALFSILLVMNPAFAGIGLKGDVAYYAGSISEELNQEFFNRVHGKVVNRLVITSDGGDVSAGIALGLWIHTFRVDIEVREYCLSSCANYVFTAGVHKIITPGAVVAWHGNYNHLKQTGDWRDEVPLRMKSRGEDEVTATRRVRQQVDQLVRMEKDFFKRISVDEYICWVGKMPPYNAPNYYFLSDKDMAMFGLGQVQTPRRYEQTDVSRFREQIMYLSLQK